MLTGALSPVSNDETWIVAISVLEDDGDGFDLDDYDIEISVMDRDRSVVLSGDTDGGEIVKSNDDDGVTSIFTWTFSASAMSALPPGNYSVGVRLVGADETRQLIASTLQVSEGYFTP